MIRLNHIGIAVADLEAREKLEKFFAILGLKSNHTEVVAEQGVKTHFLPIQADQGGAHFELLEVLDPEGTVAQFIKKRGPGIHHLSFTVPRGELDRLSEKLRAAGYRLIYDEARDGAHHMRINFVHPASAGGMLLEIAEAGLSPATRSPATRSNEPRGKH